MENLRAYHFSNFYLSSIQQGIQAAHAQTNLLKQYCGPDNSASQESTDMVWEWVKTPTMICLNGGNENNLHETYNLFQDASRFPFSAFFEDQDSLGGSLTNVMILLPEYMYTAYGVLVSDSEFNSFKELFESDGYSVNIMVKDFLEKHEAINFSIADVIIIDYIKKHGLAR